MPRSARLHRLLAAAALLAIASDPVLAVVPRPAAEAAGSFCRRGRCCCAPPSRDGVQMQPLCTCGKQGAPATSSFDAGGPAVLPAETRPAVLAIEFFALAASLAPATWPGDAIDPPPRTLLS